MSLACDWLRILITNSLTGVRCIPMAVIVCAPTATPVAQIVPRSNTNAFGEYPLALKAYKPKFVAELVIEQ